jgi:glutathione S-transferase
VLGDGARGQTVPESSIIIEYLDRHYPGPTRFIPADPEPALQTRLRDRFYDLYVHLPMQKIMVDRLWPADKRDPRGVEEARAQLRASYAMIEQQMAAGTWAMGEAFSLADCAAAPSLFYGNMAVPFGEDQKNLRAYFERLKARPSFARVIKEAEPYFGMVPKEGS